MEIVSGAPAPTQEPDIVRETLLELAAVIRTIFGAPAPVEQAPVPQPQVEQVPTSAPAPRIAPLEVPDLPLTPVELPEPAPVAIPQNAIPVPEGPYLAPTAHDDTAERHSMALLQEIAFLDD